MNEKSPEFHPKTIDYDEASQVCDHVRQGNLTWWLHRAMELKSILTPSCSISAAELETTRRSS